MNTVLMNSFYEIGSVTRSNARVARASRCVLPTHRVDSPRENDVSPSARTFAPASPLSTRLGGTSVRERFPHARIVVVLFVVLVRRPEQPPQTNGVTASARHSRRDHLTTRKWAPLVPKIWHLRSRARGRATTQATNGSDQRRHAHTDSRPPVSTVCFAGPQSRRKSSKSSKKQCPRRYPVGNFIFDSKKIISPRATFGRHAKSATLLLSSDSGRMAK